MFTYTFATNADKGAFNRACSLIEAGFKGLDKEKLLEDLDGTQIQIYHSANGTIKVYNDYEVDAVYVDSEVSLDKIFR